MQKCEKLGLLDPEDEGTTVIQIIRNFTTHKTLSLQSFRTSGISHIIKQCNYGPSEHQELHASQKTVTTVLQYIRNIIPNNTVSLQFFRTTGNSHLIKQCHYSTSQCQEIHTS
jgi:AraC-like DNA-binding protein